MTGFVPCLKYPSYWVTVKGIGKQYGIDSWCDELKGKSAVVKKKKLFLHVLRRGNSKKPHLICFHCDTVLRLEDMQDVLPSSF